MSTWSAVQLQEVSLKLYNEKKLYNDMIFPSVQVSQHLLSTCSV